MDYRTLILVLMVGLYPESKMAVHPLSTPCFIFDAAILRNEGEWNTRVVYLF